MASQRCTAIQWLAHFALRTAPRALRRSPARPARARLRFHSMHGRAYPPARCNRYLSLKGPALLFALWSTARPRALTWDIQAGCTAPRERCSMHAKRFHIGYCATALEWADGGRTRVGGTSHSARDGACLGTVQLPAAQCRNRRQSAVLTGCCKAALRPSRQWRSMGCCRHEPARETLSRSLTLEEAFPVGRAIDMQ